MDYRTASDMGRQPSCEHHPQAPSVRQSPQVSYRIGDSKIKFTVDKRDEIRHLLSVGKCTRDVSLPDMNLNHNNGISRLITRLLIRLFGL